MLDPGDHWSTLLASLNKPDRVRQVVVATDDPVVLDEIETCLFDKQIQVLVLPLRDLPSPPDPEVEDQDLVALIDDPEKRQRLAERLAIAAERARLLADLRRIVTQQERLLTATAEYMGLVSDDVRDGSDPTASLGWAEESLRRAREVHDGLRRLTERLV